MVETNLTCPWCGTQNSVFIIGDNPYCKAPGCGHRPDLARADCTCPRCFKSAEEKAAERATAERELHR